MTNDNESEVLRTFVAIEINDTARAALAERIARWKKIGAKVGWVAPENLHLTLVFLGEVFRGQVEEIVRLIDETASKIEPFSYLSEGVGFFGSHRSPRVVWAGMPDPPAGLSALQADLATGIRGLGFKIEDRPFRPHLTLGRIRSGYKVDELTSTLASDKNTAFGWVNVHRVLFMRSQLGHQGVRYTIMHESALKGASNHGR